MYIVKYGDKSIEFDLVRKDVKNINLTVRPNGEIFVSANNSIAIKDIKRFVKSKGKWIVENLDYFKRNEPVKRIPREYMTGETFRYLGKQYKLKVFEGKEEGVRYFRGTIEMYVKDKTNYEHKKKMMDNWYGERIEVIFNESLDRMYKLVKRYNIKYPKLNSRKMTTRWGSCIIEENKIILNKDLIKAPKYCIDYVVLHELIHFKYSDHDFNFFNLLYILMPDWEKRKKILDEEVVRELVSNSKC